MRWLIILIGNIKHFLRKNSRDNISAIAAQSAFFIILSFVPFALFTLSVFSNFGISKDLLENYLKLGIIDDEAYYLNSFLNELYPNATGIAITTIILALWSSGKGLFAITEGIRVIYRLPNRYNWFVKRLFSMGYTFVMFLALIVALGGMVVTEICDESIRPIIEQLPAAVGIVYALRYLIVFALVVLLIAFALKMYLWRRVEDKRFAKFRLQLPGAAFTALCWIVLSMGIRIYVKYFNGFSIYGSLGTFAMLMVWIYFSMYAFLCCIQFNYIYREEIYRFNILKIFKRKS